jgi:hypothetical protein
MLKCCFSEMYDYFRLKESMFVKNLECSLRRKQCILIKIDNGSLHLLSRYFQPTANKHFSEAVKNRK